MSDHQTDQELWTAICANDQRAWAALIKKYKALVNTVPLRMGLSMSDVSDCFQQTWFLLLKNRSKIKQPDRLAAWLVTTAKRESLRILRKKSDELDNDMLDSLVDDSILPDEEMVRLERQAILESALLEIDDRCRVLLKGLFYSPEEYSYKDLAKKLNIPINSFGPIRHRCLAKLKVLLNNKL